MKKLVQFYLTLLLAGSSNSLYGSADLRGHILVLTGPSGTGKSTLMTKLNTRYSSLRRLISHTSRPPRGSEVNGVDYFFESRASFLEKVADGDFITVATAHGNLYGTSKDFVSNSLLSGEFILCDLNTEAADAIKKLYPENVTIVFVSPPSFEVLTNRLTARETDSAEQIKLRLENALIELRRQYDYDYRLVNDDLEKSFADLLEIQNKIFLEDRTS